MPTQDDIFQAQMVQQLAANLRQGFQADEKRQQIGDQRAFQTGERVAGQEFAGQQQELRLESAERQAATRATRADTQVNIELTQQKREAFKQKIGDSFVRNGIIKLIPNPNPRLPPTAQIDRQKALGKEGFGTARGQARHMKDHIFDMRNVSEEDFQIGVEDLNASFNNLSTELKRGGIKSTPHLDFLVVKEGETKNEYVKRISAFRKSLIDREVDRRIKKEDFTKVVTGTGLGGVKFRKASPAEEAAQRERVRGRIEREIEQEFTRPEEEIDD